MNEKKTCEVLVHKKGDKQVSRNYRQVLLLPIRGKKIEPLLYNNLFEFFIKDTIKAYFY